MRIHKHLIALTAVAVFTVLAGAPAANARTADVEAASGGTAPACVEREVFPVTKEAKITNHCSTTVQVKVVIDVGPDSACHRMPPGSWFVYLWPYGYYGKTAVCG